MKNNKLIFYALFLLNSCFIFSQVQIGQDIDGVANNEFFGSSLSISSNGNIVAIGTPYNNEVDFGAGQVRVYSFNGSQWIQLGQDINGTESGDNFGVSVSLSSDGNRLAIGAIGNLGAPTNKKGKVQIYDLINGTWTQVGLDIVGKNDGDRLGISVSLSENGIRLAAGAQKNDDNGEDSGHVRTYELISGNWSQIGQDLNGEDIFNDFGYSVSLSGDGNRIAVGALHNDDNGVDAGQVKIFEYNGSNWVQIGTNLVGQGNYDFFGVSVALDHNGSRLIVGADEVNNGYGYANVYDYSESTWTQVGSSIIAENDQDRFGHSVSINGNGSNIVIGAPWNDGNGNSSGHTRIYSYVNNNWLQLGGDIDGEYEGDWSGRHISVSKNANMVAISGDWNDDNGNNSGHVRIYDFSSALSIDDINNEKSITFFPNPVKEKLNINLSFFQTERAKFQVYDITGRIIKIGYLKEEHINFSDIPNGIYVLKVSVNHINIIKSIVKK